MFQTRPVPSVSPDHLDHSAGSVNKIVRGDTRTSPRRVPRGWRAARRADAWRGRSGPKARPAADPHDLQPFPRTSMPSRRIEATAACERHDPWSVGSGQAGRQAGSAFQRPRRRGSDDASDVTGMHRVHQEQTQHRGSCCIRSVSAQVNSRKSRRKSFTAPEPEDRIPSTPTTTRSAEHPSVLHRMQLRPLAAGSGRCGAGHGTGPARSRPGGSGTRTGASRPGPVAPRPAW